MGWRFWLWNRAGVIFGQVGEIEEVMAENGFGKAVQDQDQTAIRVAIPEDGMHMDVITTQEESHADELLMAFEEMILFVTVTEVIFQQYIGFLHMRELPDGWDERSLKVRQV